MFALTWIRPLQATRDLCDSWGDQGEPEDRALVSCKLPARTAHAGIDSGGAKPAVDLCKGTRPRRAKQAHGQLSAGGAGWRGPAGRCWRAAVLAVQGRGQTE